MRWRLYSAALLMLLAALSISSLAVSDDVSADESAVNELRGYVYEFQGENLTPMANVKVTMWLDVDTVFNTATTDKNGLFTTAYDESVTFISFEKEQYSVTSCYEVDMSPYGQTSLYKLNRDAIEAKETGGVHNLYGDMKQTAIMMRATSTISGYITGNVNGMATALKGASVTLTSMYAPQSTKTDDNGYFEVVCSIGTPYQVTVQAGGFVDYSIGNIYPSEEQLYITLAEKSHEVIMGLDLVHTLELFGCLLLLLIALSTIYLIKRPEKEDGIFIVNDTVHQSPSGDEDEDEDDQF